MKAYPITEDELENLGLLSIGTTATFSAASFLGAFFLSVQSSIALSNGVKPEVTSYWEGLSNAAGVSALILVILGGYLLYRGSSKIAKIKGETDHG